MPDRGTKYTDLWFLPKGIYRQKDVHNLKHLENFYKLELENIVKSRRVIQPPIKDDWMKPGYCSFLLIVLLFFQLNCRGFMVAHT